MMNTSANKAEGIGIYVTVYILLMALLVATVGVSKLDLGRGNVIAALVIAALKALLVILFFMHVRHSSRLIWIFSAAAFFWLLILLFLTLTDYATRVPLHPASPGEILVTPAR